MKKTTKCIFLVVHQGFEARYLLRTDIFKELKKHVEKIIIVTPNADENYFKKEFQEDNVHIERFQNEKCEEFLRNSKGQRFFRLIRSFVLNAKYDLKTLDDHYKIFTKETPAKDFISKSKHLAIHIIVKLLRTSKILRKSFLWFECRLFSPDIHTELFKKYKPDIVITTSLGNVGNGFDFFIMREAKKYEAKIATVILSWDNTSGKGMGAAIPDHIIAWTELMKKELIEYHDFPQNKVSIGGIAHFDTYYREENFLTKEKIFKKFDLDIDKKLIFFATKSPTSYPWNADIAYIIAEAIAKKKISFPAQLLIRIHPLHFLVKKNNRVHIHLVDEYYKIAEKYSFVKIDKPEILSDKLTMDMPEFEQIKLVSILRYTDVLVNIFSTLNIEASIMDVPAVNIVFEGKTERKKRVRQSIYIDLNQVHNQRIIATGALEMCYNSEELITSINDSLNNTSLNKEQRDVLVEQEAGPFKGTAGRKIAKIMMKLLQDSDQYIDKAKAYSRNI